MKKSVKISKKTGIALFVTAAVIMALLIVFHKNPGPAVDQSQELAKKSSVRSFSCSGFGSGRSRRNSTG